MQDSNNFDKFKELNKKGITKEEKKNFNESFDPKKTQKIEDSKQNRSERKIYARWSFIIISVWLVGILGIVITSKWLALSSSVLITLLSTTTVNVLGLVWIVSSYLFPKDTNSKKEYKKG